MNKCEQCKNFEEKEPEFEMWLKVSDPSRLRVMVGHTTIADISQSGQCRFLNSEVRIKLYENWRKAGMIVRDQKPVKWRGGEYVIFLGTLLCRTDIGGGEIYNFKYCSYCAWCEDDNIERLKHNLKPIGF